jgi:hypothetical protein
MSIFDYASQTQPEPQPIPPEQLEETTLIEPVYVTIGRDLKRIGVKLFHVLVPRVWSHHSRGVEALRDWDLWGPLLFCLILAVFLYIEAPAEDASLVFAVAFVIVWAGAFVITVNCYLLGGNASFFQSVCLLGYCIFPLVIATIVTSFWSNKIFRLVVVAVGFVWSTVSSIGFFAGMVPPNRKALATYPVFLFYLMISWMILIQSWNGTRTTPLSPTTPVASPVASPVAPPM